MLFSNCKNHFLEYISDDQLKVIVSDVLTTASVSLANISESLYDNVIDPFSALFDSMCQNIDYATWLKQEQARQLQKSLQNKIGTFHQNILGASLGWTDLKTGEVVDLHNPSLKILAEVKNKFNTTKGNHKVAIYDDFISKLTDNNYNDYTCYYVEVIPLKKKVYNKPFTPSDNVTKTQRAPNDKIRVIDGKSFYHLATGRPKALRELFDALPKVIGDILHLNKTTIAAYTRNFDKLYLKAYTD